MVGGFAIWNLQPRNSATGKFQYDKRSRRGLGVTDDVIEDTKQKQFILCAVQSDGTVTKVLVDSNCKIQTVSS